MIAILWNQLKSFKEEQKQKGQYIDAIETNLKAITNFYLFKTRELEDLLLVTESLKSDNQRLQTENEALK